VFRMRCAASSTSWQTRRSRTSHCTKLRIPSPPNASECKRCVLPLDLYLRNSNARHTLRVCYSVAGGARTRSRTQTTSVTFLNSSITWRNVNGAHIGGGGEGGGQLASVVPAGQSCLCKTRRLCRQRHRLGNSEQATLMSEGDGGSPLQTTPN
jgi:hypothetical protein